MNFLLLCSISAFLVTSVQGNLRHASRIVGKPCTYAESIHGPTYRGVCKFGNQCPTSVSNIRAGINVSRCYSQNNIMVLCCNAEKRISQVQCEKLTSSAPPSGSPSSSKTSAHETQNANTDKLYPFVVVLEHVTSRQKTSWSCTGSLISPSHVLTSAKCVSDHEPKQVLAGSVHLFRLSPGSNFKHMIGQQERQVAQVIKHPDYTSGQAYNDIAIVKLAKPFQITEDVAPICLASPSMLASSPHNFPITTLGWGHAKDDESSDTVQPVDIQKWDWIKCKEWGDKFRQEVDEAHNTIPTGMSKGHGCGHRMERCDADSGGPVIANHGRSNRNYLVGIVTSSVTSCSTADAPVVYSNVQSHLSWIEQTVWGSGVPPSKPSHGQSGALAALNTGHKLAQQHQSSRNMGQPQTQFQKPNLQDKAANDQQHSEVQSPTNHSTQATSEKSSNQDQQQSERDLMDPKPLELSQGQSLSQLFDHQQPAQMQPQLPYSQGFQNQGSMQQQHISGQSRTPSHEVAQDQSQLQQPMQQSSQTNFQSSMQPQLQIQNQMPIKLTRSQYELILQQMAQTNFQSSALQQTGQNPQTSVQQSQGSQHMLMELTPQNQQQQSSQASGQNRKNPINVPLFY